MKILELPTRTHVSTIALAWFGYWLANCLEYLGETNGQKRKRIALSKSIKFLRNAGGLDYLIKFTSVKGVL